MRMEKNNKICSHQGVKKKKKKNNPCLQGIFFFWNYFQEKKKKKKKYTPVKRQKKKKKKIHPHKTSYPPWKPNGASLTWMFQPKQHRLTKTKVFSFPFHFFFSFFPQCTVFPWTSGEMGIWMIELGQTMGLSYLRHPFIVCVHSIILV